MCLQVEKIQTDLSQLNHEERHVFQWVIARHALSNRSLKSVVTSLSRHCSKRYERLSLPNFLRILDTDSVPATVTVTAQPELRSNKRIATEWCLSLSEPNPKHSNSNTETTFTLRITKSQNQKPVLKKALHRSGLVKLFRPLNPNSRYPEIARATRCARGPHKLGLSDTCAAVDLSCLRLSVAQGCAWEEHTRIDGVRPISAGCPVYRTFVRYTGHIFDRSRPGPICPFCKVFHNLI